MDYDVIIVGAGPAGIFAALTLADMGVPHVLLLEKGKDLSLRRHHSVEDRLCGWGGAGAFSDGKLTLSIEVGGALGDYIGPKDLHALLERTDEMYVAHGAPDRIFGGDWVQVEALADQAKLADLELIPNRIRHIGTENCRIVLERFRASLAERIEIHTETEVRDILVDQGRVQGVRLADGRCIHARFVVVAPGRSGARWMKEQAGALGLRTRSTSVDIGVRVELPALVLKAITDATYESKLIHYSKTFDEKVRTFCMNPYGEVVTEETNGIISVNGHSYAEKRSENTNFAILVSSFFTEPFDDPIAYGRDIAGLANLLGGGVIIQRLGDLLAGRRSTPKRIERCLTKPTLSDATPGDLSFVFPYRHLLSIIEMLQALDRIAPAVYSRHTLLYGVEVKFYSNRTDVTPEMETAINNLFVIGDGAGITRGLLQASASGTLAAKAIGKRMAV
ncbi:MAG: uncharacterized protein QG552_2596 [Thermodesulfobacteriota bacterium]|nr:uncharacterized protein [Thermodesulfobacteriota bacterium]